MCVQMQKMWTYSQIWVKSFCINRGPGSKLLHHFLVVKDWFKAMRSSLKTTKSIFLLPCLGLAFNHADHTFFSMVCCQKSRAIPQILRINRAPFLVALSSSWDGNHRENWYSIFKRTNISNNRELFHSKNKKQNRGKTPTERHPQIKSKVGTYYIVSTKSHASSIELFAIGCNRWIVSLPSNTRLCYSWMVQWMLQHHRNGRTIVCVECQLIYYLFILILLDASVVYDNRNQIWGRNIDCASKLWEFPCVLRRADK